MTATRWTLLHLLRATLTDDVEGAILPESLDWVDLIEEADRQGVAVLASDGLQKLYDMGMYSAVDDREIRRLKACWFGKTMKYERRYEGQLAAACKMGLWLSEVGIQTVVMKGFTVADYYPVPSHRYSSDLDCFLIKEGEHMEAYELGNQTMEMHGVEVNRSYYKNSSFNLPGLHVENHKFCTPFRGNNTLLELERVLQKTMLNGPLRPLGETGLFVPPLMFSALFLTEHAYSHFLHEGLTLRHILDWALFRRQHSDDVDWPCFDTYCSDFGLSRFLASMNAVGDFLLGYRSLETFEPIDRRFLDDIWKGPSLHSGKKGLRARISLVGNTLCARWKYHAYSNLSMPRALWIQVKGFLFIRKPKLG